VSLIDYLTGTPWALHPPVLENFVDIFQRHFDGVKLGADQIEAIIANRFKAESDDGEADQKPASREGEVVIEGRTAYVPVRGVLARFSDQVNGISQPRGRSYEQLVKDLRAAASEDIDRLVMLCTSPGGAVHGVQEAADAVRQIAATGVEVIAYADGLMASAMYFIASQADRIVASPNAIVGSIGVIAVIRDESQRYESAGIKLHVLRSGPHKAVGQPGEAIDPDLLNPERALIASMFGAFKSYVAAGRGLDGEALDVVSDGRIWPAEDARDLGLVDDVMGLDEFKAELAGVAPFQRPLPLHRTAAAAAAPAGDPIVIRPGWTAEEAAAFAAGATNLFAEADLAPAPLGAPAPATDNKESTMTMDKEKLAALVAKHPKHAALITQAYAEGKTEDQVLAAIAQAEQAAQVESLTQERDQARADLEQAAADRDQARTDLEQAAAERDDLKAKLAKVQGWQADAGQADDAGSDASVDPGTTDTSDAALKARWESMDAATKVGEFMGDYDTFAAWSREKATGRAPTSAQVD